MRGPKCHSCASRNPAGVIPAQAGIQEKNNWIPTSVAVTSKGASSLPQPSRGRPYVSFLRKQESSPRLSPFGGPLPVIPPKAAVQNEVKAHVPASPLTPEQGWISAYTGTGLDSRLRGNDTPRPPFGCGVPVTVFSPWVSAPAHRHMAASGLAAVPSVALGVVGVPLSILPRSSRRPGRG